MQNGNSGHDIGPDEIRMSTMNGEILQPNFQNDMVPIDVISGFTEDENGEMEVEYERAFVHRPPGGVFYEPLDYGPESTPASSVTRRSTKQLYMEKERLATFEGNWSPDYPVQPGDLARDGLYYVGPGDKVKCVFCQKTIDHWELGDVVDKEHKRIYPNCPFVLGRCNQMNVPSNSSETYQHSYGVKVRQEEGQPAVANPMQDLSARLRTFENKWPRTVPVEPRLIAEAGLYYIGVRDKTKCFHCPIIIERWEAGDDPWTEHARLSQRCPYVLEMKGKEFVDAVLNPTSSGDTFSGASPQGNSEEAEMKQSQEVETSGIIGQMSNLQIDEDMKSPAVNAFKEYFEDVPVDRIRQMLERIRLEKGPSYTLTSSDLAQSYLADQ